MNSFPFLSTARFLIVLRVAIGLMLAAHGAIRIYAGTVGEFGGFLAAKGFPAGVVLAWSITLYELIGGLTLAVGFARRWISLGFVLHLLMGIVLVHAQNGWFVVGYTSGGAEYSTLLILCFLIVASTDPEKPAP